MLNVHGDTIVKYSGTVDSLKVKVHVKAECALLRILVFVTHKGFVQPCRPAGSYTVHTRMTVHGVTRMEGGVRYGLFFVGAPLIPA